MTAIEITGIIDENHQLHLDGILPISGPIPVRVIVLYPATEEFDETKWLQAAATNPSFEYLSDPEEDIYSLADGKPVH
ncbi:MAG: hypothetical protein HYR94_10930 [Chloroflexi bacterium]|nr:hypothetical protein [Chloroflexota bacterium]